MAAWRQGAFYASQNERSDEETVSSRMEIVELLPEICPTSSEWSSSGKGALSSGEHFILER